MIASRTLLSPLSSRPASVILTTSIALALTPGCIFFQDGSSNTSTPPEDMSVDLAHDMASDLSPPQDLGQDSSPSPDMTEPLDTGTGDDGLPIDMDSSMCTTHEECGNAMFCNMIKGMCEGCDTIKAETICRGPQTNTFRCKEDPIPEDIVTHCSLSFSTKKCICPATTSYTCTSMNLCEESCIDDDDFSNICERHPVTTEEQASYQKFCSMGEAELRRCDASTAEAPLSEFVYLDTRVASMIGPSGLGTRVALGKDFAAIATGPSTDSTPAHFRLYQKRGRAWELQSPAPLIMNVQQFLMKQESQASLISVGDHVAFLDDDILAISITYSMANATRHDVLFIRLGVMNTLTLIEDLKLPRPLDQPIADMDASNSVLALGVGSGTTSRVRLYKSDGTKLQEEKTCDAKDDGTRFSTYNYRDMGSRVEVVTSGSNTYVGAVFVAQRSRTIPMQRDYVVDICTTSELDEKLENTVISTGFPHRALYEPTSEMNDTPRITESNGFVHIADRTNNQWVVSLINLDNADIPEFTQSYTLPEDRFEPMQAISANKNSLIAYTTKDTIVTINSDQNKASKRSVYTPYPSLDGVLRDICLANGGDELIVGNPGMSTTGGAYFGLVSLK